jgi:mono/diheme cytochrome c family protein
MLVAHAMIVAGVLGWTAAGADLRAQSGAAGPRASVRDGLYSAAQAARGKVAYERNCAECHMPDLAGHEYAGALAGYAFQLKWQDASLGEFFGRVRSMPLGRPGSLTSQEYLDIVAYALQKNGYPEGTHDLTAAIATQWPPVRIERTQRMPTP